MPAIVGAVYDPPAMCEIVGTAKAFLAQRQLFSRSDSFSRAATAFLVQRQLFSRSDSFSRAATAFLAQRQLFSPSDRLSCNAQRLHSLAWTLYCSDRGPL